MNTTDGNDSNQAEPPNQKRTYSQLTDNLEIQEIEPELNLEPSINSKRACLNTENATTSNSEVGRSESVELIKEVATTSGEATSGQVYFNVGIGNESSSESDDDDDLFNIDGPELPNEDVAAKITTVASGEDNRPLDEATVITDDEDEQVRSSQLMNLNAPNGGSSSSDINFSRNRHRDNGQQECLNHNMNRNCFHIPTNHNNQYQHYHHIRQGNHNNHSYTCNQFNRHTNHRQPNLGNNQNVHAYYHNRAYPRHNQVFVNFTNNRPAACQQHTSDNNLNYCSNDFVSENQREANQTESLLSVPSADSAIVNAPEQVIDETNSFADSFINFVNHSRPDNSQTRQYERHHSPRYINTNTNTGVSSSLVNDMNCLSSNYVPPNAQLSYLPRRASTAHLFQNSRFNNNNAATNSHHNHDINTRPEDQLEDQIQQQPQYIPSSLRIGNNSNQSQVNTCANNATGQGSNSHRNPRNCHYNYPINMHANFTRLWHEQNNQMEMHRNANLQRRLVNIFFLN